MNTPDSPPLPREFVEIVDRVLSGSGTAADAAALERHLVGTPGAMAYYLAHAEVEALLPDALGAQAVPARVIRPAASFWRRRRSLIPAALAFAACLAIGFLLFLAARTSPEARLTRTMAARWAEGSGPGAGGMLGTGSLESGYAELTLASGVRLLVEGPAKFDITGKNACRLAYGKAVADVPPAARGFIIDAPGERIIDHGTRFAVDAARGGSSTLVGVLSGEVEVRHAGREVRLFTDYALQRDASGLLSVPFVRDSFATEMPSREFAWELPRVIAGTPVTLRFDVSRLVCAPGDYRAVFKWMGGSHALRVDSLALTRDGREVARCSERGMTGLIERTTNNTPVLAVPPSEAGSGVWELVAVVAASGSEGDSDCRGIVTLESGLAVNATAKDFIGRWVYSNNGDTCVREFLHDGTMRMSFNGKRYKNTDGATYTVQDGILTVSIPREGLRERHMLRDDGTLLFINRPYRNARRE